MRKKKKKDCGASERREGTVDGSKGGEEEGEWGESKGRERTEEKIIYERSNYVHPVHV